MDGILKARYVYDEWGNHKVLDHNGIENNNKEFIGNVNPIRYRGYYFDSETELYYLQTRYYDPSTGRFVNADSIDYADPESINGLNLYVYCNSNPIMRHDPSGTAWWNPLDHISNGISAVNNAVDSVVGWVDSGINWVIENKDMIITVITVAAFVVAFAAVVVFSGGTAAALAPILWGAVIGAAAGGIYGGGSAYLKERTS